MTEDWCLLIPWAQPTPNLSPLSNKHHLIPPSFLSPYPLPFCLLLFVPSKLLHSYDPRFPVMVQHPLIKENIRALVFWDWLTSFSTKFSNSIHLPTNAMIYSPLWLSNIPLCIYTTLSLSIHLLKGI